jgi:hypothetical protein
MNRSAKDLKGAIDAPRKYAEENRALDAKTSGAYLAALAPAELLVHFRALITDLTQGETRVRPERLSMTIVLGPARLHGLQARLVGMRSGQSSQSRIPFEVASHFDATTARRLLGALWAVGRERAFSPSESWLDFSQARGVPLAAAFGEVETLITGLPVRRCEISYSEGAIERGAQEPASGGFKLELAAPDGGRLLVDPGPALGEKPGRELVAFATQLAQKHGWPIRP